jgi:hypothetical protein
VGHPPQAHNNHPKALLLYALFLTCANDWFKLPHMPSPSHVGFQQQHQLIFFGSARRSNAMHALFVLVPYQQPGPSSILGPNRVSLRTGSPERARAGLNPALVTAPNPCFASKLLVCFYVNWAKGTFFFSDRDIGRYSSGSARSISSLIYVGRPYGRAQACTKDPEKRTSRNRDHVHSNLYTQLRSPWIIHTGCGDSSKEGPLIIAR